MSAPSLFEACCCILGFKQGVWEFGFTLGANQLVTFFDLALVYWTYRYATADRAHVSFQLVVRPNEFILIIFKSPCDLAILFSSLRLRVHILHKWIFVVLFKSISTISILLYPFIQCFPGKSRRELRSKILHIVFQWIFASVLNIRHKFAVRILIGWRILKQELLPWLFSKVIPWNPQLWNAVFQGLLNLSLVCCELQQILTLLFLQVWHSGNILWLRSLRLIVCIVQVT